MTRTEYSSDGFKNSKHGSGIVIVPLPCFASVVCLWRSGSARDRAQRAPCASAGIVKLASGLCISDYSLHTVRYNLKNAYIPAFTGRVTVTARLPVPLLELWNALLCWAPYSGIGIKTALGMGGVDVRFAEKRTAQGE